MAPINTKRLPGRDFFYDSLAPSSTTTIASQTIWITSLVISNITANDETVTLTTAETAPVTQLTFTISARDLQSRSFQDGWQFTSGIKISCTTGSAVQVQIYGKQKS